MNQTDDAINQHESFMSFGMRHEYFPRFRMVMLPSFSASSSPSGNYIFDDTVPQPGRHETSAAPLRKAKTAQLVQDFRNV